jgi:dolichol-phosphate hexosyltransferase
MRSDLGEGGTLSVGQPGSASGGFTVEDPSHLHYQSVVPPGQPSLTAVTVNGAPAQSARHNNSFHAKPLKLSILMAAYNEEITIGRAVDKILKANYPCEIELIVVDDGSTDTTPMLLSRVKDPRVMVCRHSANQGKGAALLTAASLATGTHILPFDADLEYVAEDIPRVLEPVLEGRCEVVYGVRLPGSNTVYRSYLYVAGNRLLTRMANVLFNARLSDLHTCLKLMPLVMLRSLDLREKGFGLDSEITARLLRRGIRPFEVPISYYGRSHAEGKKITWRDGVACTLILLRVRLRSPVTPRVR